MIKRDESSMRTQSPIAIDCFAGCGGMSEGLRQAGFSVVGAIEIDVDAARTYKLNHPDVHIWQQDISEVSAVSVLKKLGIKKGELYLLGGCPPCQGFSSLRTKNGKRRIRDDRNDLIYEFRRLALELLPKHVMMENVPKLYKDRRLKDFVRSLKEVGYSVRAEVLNVVDFGVPQRRRRTVVVASRTGLPPSVRRVDKHRTVKSAIGALPLAGSSGDPLHDIPEKRSALVSERIRAIPKNGGGRSALPEDLSLRCHSESDGFKDVYGRMAWDKPAPTITTGCFNPSKGRFLHPIEDRAITIREASLLQSFPMSYKFPVELGKVKLAQMVGNALPPAFIKCHAEVLLDGVRDA